MVSWWWPVPAEEVAGEWLGSVARATEGDRENRLGRECGKTGMQFGGRLSEAGRSQ